jgi:hypothetical protein
MNRRLIALLVCGFITAPLFGCQGKTARFNPVLSRDFFPLVPETVWTYRVQSKSQRSTYVVTDKAVGEKYVPSLNVTGQVVEEYYNLERGGTRPIVYVTNGDYWTRLSGLDYAKDDIEAPAWGRSEEGQFMPASLLPDLSWDSKIFPFGHMPGAFDIKQTHRSFFESGEVVVPAGHFIGCMRIETDALYEGGSYAKSNKPMRLTYEDYYAPHVGLIKTLALEGGPGGPVMEKVELLRYLPAQKTAQAASPQAAQ